MKQVAGILIGDAQEEWLERFQLGDESERGEKFGDVFHFALEGGGLRILGLVR